jgi:hypothetical protein
MNPIQLRQLMGVDSNAIVELLTARQHAHPRVSVAATMEYATRQLGCCPAAIARAVDWLQMDVSRPIGRVRRSELLQLARSVYRFWRHTTPPDKSREINTVTNPRAGRTNADAAAPARR